MSAFIGTQVMNFAIRRSIGLNYQQNDWAKSQV